MWKSSHPFHVALCSLALLSLAWGFGWLDPLAAWVAEVQKAFRPATQYVIVRAEVTRCHRRWLTGYATYHIREVLHGPASLKGMSFQAECRESPIIRMVGATYHGFPPPRAREFEVWHLNYLRNGALTIARRFPGRECLARSWPNP